MMYKKNTNIFKSVEIIIETCVPFRFALQKQNINNCTPNFRGSYTTENV